MSTIKCPHCGKEVKVIPFGDRYIAVCCDQVIYVGQALPQHYEKDVVDKDYENPS